MRLRPGHAAVALSLLFGLAGCMEGGPPDATETSSERPATTTTVVATAGDVVLAGHVETLAEGHAGNISAHNTGGHTYGYSQTYCVSPYGAMHASLSGPPGENLTYRDPDQVGMGCPAKTSTLRPGGYVNWTVAPRDAGQCNTRGVCDNYWDGRLWSAPNDSGPGTQAPAGTYTWRFTFDYYDSPMGTAATPGPENKPYRHKEIGLQVIVS